MINYIFENIQYYMEDETGASVIEVAVIIVILVIVALVFKDQLVGVLTAVMDKVTEKITAI